MIAYITEQGSSIFLKGKRLVLKKNGKVIQNIHAYKLQQLIIMGKVMLSPAVVSFLLKNNIDTVYMTFHGEYRGRLASGFSKNIELRLNQFKRVEDKLFSISMAKEFVKGKLQNYRYLLRKLYQDIKIEEIELSLHKLRSTLNKLETSQDMDEIRGYEGYGSAEYFSAFKYGIKNPDFVFQNRTRRPPRDFVNAMLSFGYTMLLNSMITIVYIVGLDPFLGNLHSIDYGRPSLALDLIEEFRPIIVDSLVLKLINKRCFNKNDFIIKAENKEDTNEATYSVFLNKEGLRKFIHYFEQKLAERQIYFPAGQKLAYRQIMEKQARLYADALKNNNYKSFVMI